ncbi:hypothetical protein AAG570_002027 [Ranatra chinensis]|uniref:Zinc finger CCHC domain-containing protein 2 n=1 Tax=Ranatra chinensis TaxID=642074 RepID=A0ABD0YM27_9HEMI
MVCKKDVVAWFKNLKSYKRTDLMCSLLNLCLPFELRFLGTCLEDLGKRDFHELRQAENDANHPAEINSPDLQAISGHRARTKLALYVSLLYSCNYTCSKGIFRILAKNDEIENLLKTNSLTEEVLEDLLLVYTLALNHPAFSYEQKLTLEKIYERLQEEECRLYEQTSAARTNKSGFNSTPTVQEAPQIHEKPPQLQVPNLSDIHNFVCTVLQTSYLRVMWAFRQWIFCLLTAL